MGQLNKNVLSTDHKKFERVQHAEKYLLGIDVQHEQKIKLFLTMVSKHVLLYPDYKCAIKSFLISSVNLPLLYMYFGLAVLFHLLRCAVFFKPTYHKLK